MTQLGSKKLELACDGIRFNVFRAKPEPDTPIETMLDRAYWAHVSVNLRPGDKIEVIPEDYSYFVELLVLSAGKLYADVRLLREVKLTEPVKVEAGYEIKHRGPKGWCVLRGKDILAEMQGTKEVAKAWLDEYLKAA